MSTTIPPLEALEDRTYRTRHDDGLLDLMVGLGLAAIGASWLGDVAWAGSFAPVLLIPIWIVLRKSITAPRVGTFRSREERRKLETRKFAWLVFLGLLVLVAGVALYLRLRTESPGDRIMSYVPALPGLLLGLAAVASAMIFGLRRFLIYAMVLIVASGAAVEQRFEPGLYMAEVGMFVAIVGAAMLVAFIRKNPLPDLGDHA